MALPVLSSRWLYPLEGVDERYTAPAACEVEFATDRGHLWQVECDRDHYCMWMASVRVGDIGKRFLENEDTLRLGSQADKRIHAVHVWYSAPPC